MMGTAVKERKINRVRLLAVGTLKRYSKALEYETTRTHGPLYSSSIRHSQQDSLLYTQFFRTHLCVI
jgi:hypothetical protein